jgi:hypothetical protein
MDTPGLYYNKLIHERSVPIGERFPGFYRAIVVDTNDPLNMGRVRFLCPEMHNNNLSVGDAPFAVPAPGFGGPRSGMFSNPCIGDGIWVSFEKQHPFGPIWFAGADPTRQRYYTRYQVTNPSPVSLSVDAQPQGPPEDYDADYLPKDGRPMSYGYTDRYGTTILSSAVGFFPTTHSLVAPPAEYDPYAASFYKNSKAKPEVNSPDRKYHAEISKYGNIFQLSDVGYYWYKQDDLSDVGEFIGDPIIDEPFEDLRFKYLQQLLNEGHPNTANNGVGIPGTDQRKASILTRYGHKWEQRDVGYAQPGPTLNAARPDEYGEGQFLSLETQSDMRWLKWRSKAGNLYQASDVGYDPAFNYNILKTNLEDAGYGSEKEDQYFDSKDMRMTRIVSAGGLKLVLDDRGADVADPIGNPWPCSNGFMIKGRRPAGSFGIKPAAGTRATAAATIVGGRVTDVTVLNQGSQYVTPPVITITDPNREGRGAKAVATVVNGYVVAIAVTAAGNAYADAVVEVEPPPYARGFYLEANENDLSNHLTIGSPLGSVFELNDRYQYSILTNGLGKDYTMPWKGIKENEFLRTPTIVNSPEFSTYHLKLDLQNEYLRLKTRGGKGIGPEIDRKGAVNPSGVTDGIQAGLEAHDGQKGDGPWVELVDNETRGFWFSKKLNMGVWRGKKGKKTYFIIDDANDSISIINSQPTGTIQLYSAGSINMRAEQRINMYAGQGISMSTPQSMVLAGGAAKIGMEGIGVNVTGIPTIGNIGQPIIPPPVPNIPSKLEPTDRGATYNGPFESCPESEIEHQLDSLFSQVDGWLPAFAR